MLMHAVRLGQVVWQSVLEHENLCVSVVPVVIVVSVSHVAHTVRRRQLNYRSSHQLSEQVLLNPWMDVKDDCLGRSFCFVFYIKGSAKRAPEIGEEYLYHRTCTVTTRDESRKWNRKSNQWGIANRNRTMKDQAQQDQEGVLERINVWSHQLCCNI